MGSAHDIEHSGGSQGIFPFSYGFQDPDGDFRTIMAYPCEGKEDGCPRLNAWSTPNLTYNNKPLGIADEADNVRSLNTALN